MKPDYSTQSILFLGVGLYLLRDCQEGGTDSYEQNRCNRLDLVPRRASATYIVSHKRGAGCRTLVGVEVRTNGSAQTRNRRDS